MLGHVVVGVTPVIGVDRCCEAVQGNLQPAHVGVFDERSQLFSINI